MGLGGSESAPPCDDLPEIAALLEELAAVADFGARTATLWDARDGRKLRVFPGGNDREEEHSDDVMSAAFSPAGRQVATASTDGYCRIWDAATGAQVKAIPHDIAVRSAEFNPQGDLLLTAAADGMARLWTLPDYQLRT